MGYAHADEANTYQKLNHKGEYKMTIKTEINESQFINALCNDQYAAWSRCAARALFDWYTELSECTGEEIDFDPIAIRCDWSEMDTDEIVEQYGHLFSEAENFDELYEALLDHTSAIPLDNNNYLIMAF